MLGLARSSVMLAAVSLGALGTIAAPAGADDETPVTFKAFSADGTKVFFETAEPLLATDTDSAVDVYVGGSGTLGLRSDGVQGLPDAEVNARFRAINGAGTLVAFETAEPLRAEDGDSATDVYVGGSGTLGLRSDRVQPGADEAKNASFKAFNADGSLVYFTTAERLRSEDTDGAADIYVGGVGTLGLRSDRVQPGADAGVNAVFRAINTDGSLVAFETAEPLRAEDEDAATDVYVGGSGTLGLRSDRAQAGADAATNTSFKAFNADGSLVYFTTAEQLRSEDTDTAADIYVGGVGTLGIRSDRVQPGADAAINAIFRAINTDGTLVAFETAEPLRAEDGDSATDVYVGGSGTMGLRSDRVKAGPDGGSSASFKAFNADGSLVYFTTAEQLRSEDTDTAADIYVGGVGTLGIRSDGIQGLPDAGVNAVFKAINTNGSLVAFETAEPLRSEDGDTATDVYVGGSGTLGLRSDRVQPGADAAKNAVFQAFNADGSLVYLTTTEQLRSEDTDGAADIYVGGTGTLGIRSDRAQPGADAGLNAVFKAINTTGTLVAFETREPLRAEDTDTATDIYVGGSGTLGLRSDRVQP